MINNSAIRCFKVDSNKQILLSSKEYANQRKNRVINTDYSHQSNKKEFYKGPIFANKNGCLGSVGGFNTDNYNLLSSFRDGYNSNKKICGNMILDLSNVTYEMIQNPNYSTTRDTSGEYIPCSSSLKNYFDLSYINLVI
jgi:hypothetical protein